MSHLLYNTISPHFAVVDVWYLVYLVIGAIIFFSAKSWSQ